MAASAASQRVATPTVLVVEDDYQAAKLLATHITRAGYDVALAQRGDEAVVKATEMNPSAITLDILLPVQDGWDVLAQLKASPRTRDIPVVIVSVLDRQQLGFRLGAVEYLVKPVKRHELMRALGRCMLYGRIPIPPGKVMVVDEDPAELSVVAVALSGRGYQVIEALGGAETIHLARMLRPALVVVNLSAARRHRSELIAMLREDPATAGIPILALTASQAGPRERARTYPRAHAIWYRERSTEETLLQAVTHILQGQEVP
jgi:CheY-like chemotaxis protein